MPLAAIATLFSAVSVLVHLLANLVVEASGDHDDDERTNDRAHNSPELRDEKELGEVQQGEEHDAAEKGQSSPLFDLFIKAHIGDTINGQARDVGCLAFLNTGRTAFFLLTSLSIVHTFVRVLGAFVLVVAGSVLNV